MAINQPSFYLLTPDFSGDESAYLDKLLKNAPRASYVQFRSKNLNDNLYYEMALKVIEVCHSVQTPVILNTSPSLYERICGTRAADGIHLTSSALMNCESRPVSCDAILSVACHNEQQIRQAQLIAANIALISPIFKTPSSPLGVPLGWQAFRALANSCAIPIYALGGLQLSDYEEALANGATGIAAKRALWS